MITRSNSLKLPFASGIAQTCVTSPPYYGLRDYGETAQIGQEETPEAYVNQLVEVFRDVWRVLKDDGTLWLNLGDSYAGSGKGANPDGTPHPSTLLGKNGTNRGTVSGINRPQKAKDIGLKQKDLIGIPWMVAFALRADGWYLRSDIIWAKPNPMPESVRDRPTKSHEYIFLLSKSQKYYYDADAIREPYAESSKERIKYNVAKHNIDNTGGSFGKGIRGDDARGTKLELNPNGKNKRDVWNVGTKSYSGAHFATFNPELIEPCVLAGSAKGDYVLDPFNGSGTTGQVALQHGRKYLGSELNMDYIQLSKQRLEKVQIAL